MLSLRLCRDWRTSWYAVSNWRRMWSEVEFGSLYMTLTDCLERDLVGLCVDGNW